MGHNRFIAEQTLTTVELRHVYSLAHRAFPGFGDRETNDPLRVTLSGLATLPPLPSSPPLEMSAVTVTATLESSSSIWERLAAVASRAAVIAAMGRIEIGCMFEERGSEQASAEEGDRIHIFESRAGLFFGYRARSSRVARDAAYRHQFIQSMAEELSLPLVIGDPTDGMRLRSVDGTRLQITQSGIDDSDPDGFNCEVRQSTLTAELARMKRFLDRFSSGTLFSFDWIASPGESDAEVALGPPAGASLYGAIKAAELPADSFTLNCEFRLDDLSGVDEIQRLLGPDDRARVRLCSFDLSEDGWGDLVVLTSRSGHHLQLDLRVWDTLPEVESQLGIKFKEVEQ